MRHNGPTEALKGARSPFHISPIADQYDATRAVELALADHGKPFGRPLPHACPTGPDTGDAVPLATIVTDNEGSQFSSRFETYIARDLVGGSGMVRCPVCGRGHDVLPLSMDDPGVLSPATTGAGDR